MANLILFMLAYFLGVAVSSVIFHPMRNWKEGYDNAKEYYSNWKIGFDKGFKYASKIYKDYHQGFGDGFESGWYAALEQEGEQE